MKPLYDELSLPIAITITMENTSFVEEGRTGATSDSPARNGIRRSATPRRRTAPPLRTTGCMNEPESTLPVLAFRLSSPKSARARAHHSECGSPDSSRVRKPIDLCGSFGRIPSTLGLLRISGRHSLEYLIERQFAEVLLKTLDLWSILTVHTDP